MYYSIDQLGNPDGIISLHKIYLWLELSPLNLRQSFRQLFDHRAGTSQTDCFSRRLRIFRYNVGTCITAIEHNCFICEKSHPFAGNSWTQEWTAVATAVVSEPKSV